MQIDDFIWLEQFLEKLDTKHAVYPDEVAEVFRNRPQIRRINKGKIPGENVYRALGQADSGRYLFIVFIYKPSTHHGLVISARDMSDKEKRNYGRK